MNITINLPGAIAVTLLTVALTVAGVYVVRSVQPAIMESPTAITERANVDANKAVSAVNDAAVSARKAADSTEATSKVAKDAAVSGQKSAADTAKSAKDASLALSAKKP